MVALTYRDRLVRSWLVEAGQVVEAFVLTFGSKHELPLFFIEIRNLQDGLGVPILLFLFVLLFEFSSEAGTTLLFLFFFVLFLILFHLELHHLYLPGAQRVVLDQVAVEALDFGGVWTLNFVDVAVLARN